MGKQHIKISTILCTLFLALCLGEEMLIEDNGCRILVDDHDRAAMMSRNYVSGESNRWPKGVIPYVISDSFTDTEKRVILTAIQQVWKKTCAKFIPRTKEENYLEIFTGGSGCFANLGYNSQRKKSVLHLQRGGCMYERIVVHELLHILGFDHEHNRPDRDEYVKIHWENIKTDKIYNYFRARGVNEDAILPSCYSVNISQYDACYTGYRGSTFGIAYDYESVMHYGLKFLSKNGESTMSLKKEYSGRISNRDGLSYLDSQKVNAAYGCPPPPVTPRPDPNCSDTWPACKRYEYLCDINSFVNQRCKMTCFGCVCSNRIGDGACEMLKPYCAYPFIKKACAGKCGVCQ